MKPMMIQYLEIVTADVVATCGAPEAAHGLSLSEPRLALGGARAAEFAGRARRPSSTAELDGVRLDVRAPMHEVEAPVVRPYFSVPDAAAAVAAAAAQGAEVAHPAMELPGDGTFAVYLGGDAQMGVWED